MSISIGITPTRRQAPRQLMLVGIASTVTYGVTYALQRAIFPALWRGSVAAPPDRGTLLWLSGLYVLVTLVLFFLLTHVLRIASDNAGDDARSRRLLFAFPVAFTVLLAGGRPSLSIDVLSYIGHGYQARTGQSPYGYAVKDLAPTPFGQELRSNGWLAVHGASPYGALWTHVEHAVSRVSSNIVRQAILIKTLISAAHLASAWLIWMILGRIAPRQQLFGTTLYLWNPVAVMELAGDGHNDALLLVFLLLSLWLAIRFREASSVLALTMGALVKITAAMFGPLLALYWWRTAANRTRTATRVMASACAGLAMTAFLYAPFWIGRSTITGLRDHSQPSLLASTPGALLWYFSQTYSEGSTARVLSVLFAVIFLACFTIFAASIRDSRSLIQACGRIAIAYLLLAPAYWPWYTVLPIALLALSPDPPAVRAILLFSLGSRLAAPVDALRANGLISWPVEVITTTVLGLWLPLSAVVIGRAAHSLRVARLSPFPQTVVRS